MIAFAPKFLDQKKQDFRGHAGSDALSDNARILEITLEFLFFPSVPRLFCPCLASLPRIKGLDVKSFSLCLGREGVDFQEAIFAFGDFFSFLLWEVASSFSQKHTAPLV